MTDASQRGEVVVVPREDLLFYKLKDLILEQSEGEWTDAQIITDAHHFANHLRPLLAAAPPAPSGDSGAWEALATIERILSGIPKHHSHDGMVAWSVSDDVPEDIDTALSFARQALALRDAGLGSLRPSACVPSGDVDGGAGR